MMKDSNSHSSKTETSSTPTAPSTAAQLASLVEKHGQKSAQMLEEILTILGVDPTDGAELAKDEMQQTLELILQSIESEQERAYERFKMMMSVQEEALEVTKTTAKNMQFIVDALKAV